MYFRYLLHVSDRLERDNKFVAEVAQEKGVTEVSMFDVIRVQPHPCYIFSQVTTLAQRPGHFQTKK